MNQSESNRYSFEGGMNIPQPPIASHTDVRDLDGFMLNVERLMASELVALSSHEVIAAALFLWCRAWKQLPAASLPDDERVIAAFARLPLPKFRKLRSEVMRGFVKCSDGRWYHGVLAMEAAAAYSRKQTFQKRREGDAERLRKWRESKRETHSETSYETHVETNSETRFVAEGQGQGQGQGQSKPVVTSPTYSSEPIGSDGKPSNGGGQKLTDPAEIIFGYGVPLLVQAGATDKHARSFLGGLRKTHGDIALIDTLRECLRERPLQPLEWLAAALPPTGKAKGPKAENFAATEYGAGGRL